MTPLQNKIEEAKKRFVEIGADLEHARWAKWQNYLHTFLVWNNDIQMWTLPHEKKEHWDEQIRTPYSMLTEHEKEMDRKEVRTYLPLLEQELTSIATLAQEEARKEMIEKIRKSKIWKLVPNTPRMIMCSDKELDELLSTLSNPTQL